MVDRRPYAPPPPPPPQPTAHPLLPFPALKITAGCEGTGERPSPRGGPQESRGVGPGASAKGEASAVHCRVEGGVGMGTPGVYLPHRALKLHADSSPPPFRPRPHAPALFSSRRSREERLRLRHATESRNTPVGPTPPLPPPPPPPNPSGAGSGHASNRIDGAWQAGVVGVGVASAAGSGGGSVVDEGRGRRGAGAAAARQLEVDVSARSYSEFSCFGRRTDRTSS